MQETAEDAEIKYTFPRVMTLRTRFVVKVIDFDRSYLPGYENKLLDKSYCRKYGECNRFLRNWDWHQFLTDFDFYVRAARKGGNCVVEKLNLMKGENNAQRGHACTCKETHPITKDCMSCEVNYDILETLMTPNAYINRIAATYNLF